MIRRIILVVVLVALGLAAFLTAAAGNKTPPNLTGYYKTGSAATGNLVIIHVTKADGRYQVEGIKRLGGSFYGDLKTEGQIVSDPVTSGQVTLTLVDPNTLRMLEPTGSQGPNQLVTTDFTRMTGSAADLAAQWQQAFAAQPDVPQTTPTAAP